MAFDSLYPLLVTLHAIELFSVPVDPVVDASHAPLKVRFRLSVYGHVNPHRTERTEQSRKTADDDRAKDEADQMTEIDGHSFPGTIGDFVFLAVM